MKSKTNNRSWTTVAIGRDQYRRLKQACAMKRMKVKWAANDVLDGWATAVIACHGNMPPK